MRICRVLFHHALSKDFLGAPDIVLYCYLFWYENDVYIEWWCEMRGESEKMNICFIKDPLHSFTLSLYIYIVHYLFKWWRRCLHRGDDLKWEQSVWEIKKNESRRVGEITDIWSSIFFHLFFILVSTLLYGGKYLESWQQGAYNNAEDISGDGMRVMMD